MRNYSIYRLGIVASFALLACGVRPAAATVIFEENFASRPSHSGVFGDSPNITNTGGGAYLRSDNLAGATEGRIGFYGDQSLNVKGLLFNPADAANEQRAGSFAQNVAIRYDHTFGTDKVRLTLVARQGTTVHWNNFVFGFTDTDDNLSNMILLQKSAQNSNRTYAKVFNNGKIYRRQLPAPAINASDTFKTLVLEYDPTKVNQMGVNPYTLFVNDIEHTLNSRNNEGTTVVDGNPTPIDCTDPNSAACPPDVGLPAMTTDGGGTFNRMRGIGWGFWFADGAIDRTVLIESMKFEILDSPPANLGDYNHDGVVDAADYVVWRKGNAGSGTYEEWQQNFGNVYSGSGSGGGLTNVSVPELASGTLLILGLIAGCGIRRRKTVGI